MSDRRFFLFWMLAFLGFPLGGLLAIVAAGSIEGILTAAISGALAGAVIGTSQFLVLRRRVGVGVAWVPATALGLAVGDALGAALTGAGTSLAALIVTGITAGSLTGAFQWAVLRSKAKGSVFWVPIVTAAWTVGWITTWAVGVDVERGYAVFGASGALVFSAITGFALMLVVRRGEGR